MPILDTVNMKNANETTIRHFQGGICEIEKLPDEPGRNWVKVRFDAQGGGGCQFEVWDDEMPQLERDIQENFSDMSDVVGLPLAAFKKATQAMPKHPFKRKNTPAVAVNSKTSTNTDPSEPGKEN